MSLDDRILKFEERAAFSLRKLYRSFGYEQYRMSRFEEYDLYARNKDFLAGDNIITFTDTNGKLMAMKPDVTLSIVRNVKEAGSSVQRVYYDENVYRVTPRSHVFEEIRQVGLECIGALDDYCITEVLLLAVKSLADISENCVLDISHVGIIEKKLAQLNLPDEHRSRALACISEKNMHGLAEICIQAGIARTDAENLCSLFSLCGTPAEVLPRLQEAGADPDAIRQLEQVSRTLERTEPGVRLRLNLSAGSSFKYYNGIVFQGYVQGVPESVLSGGRYDRLMLKMGKKTGAIGFAVYLDRLELLRLEKKYDVDAILLYDESSDAASVLQAMEALQAQGMQAAALREAPARLRSQRVFRMTGNEVTEVEK